MKLKALTDPKKLARSAMAARKASKDDDDFLSEDGPAFDSDEYVNTTGLEDDGYVDVEGEGDKRKAMLMRAIARMKSK